MTGSNYSRDNLNLKANYKPTKRVTFDFSIRYANTDVAGAGANSLNDMGTSTSGRLRNAILYPPIPISGLTADVDMPDNSSDAVNPLVAIADSDKKRNRTTWNANAGFTWEIIDDLKLKVEAGIDDYRQQDNEFYGITSYYSRESSTVLGAPAARYANQTRRRTRNTNTLAYNFKNVIGNDDHALDLLLGQEYMITENETFTAIADGLPSMFTAKDAWSLHAPGVERQGGLQQYLARRCALLVLRARELQLQEQVPLLGDDACRRFVEVRQEPEMGLFPVGCGLVAHFGRGVAEGCPLDRQPEGALQFRYGRQQQHSDLRFAAVAGVLVVVVRPPEHRNVVPRSGYGDGQSRPDVGDDLFA